MCVCSKYQSTYARIHARPHIHTYTIYFHLLWEIQKLQLQYYSIKSQSKCALTLVKLLLFKGWSLPCYLPRTITYIYIFFRYACVCSVLRTSVLYTWSSTFTGRLRGLAVGCWTTDHTTRVRISVWAYLKVVSSLTSLHYIWRSLGPCV